MSISASDGQAAQGIDGGNLVQRAGLGGALQTPRATASRERPNGRKSIRPSESGQPAVVPLGAERDHSIQALDSWSLTADIAAIAAGDKVRFGEMFQRWAPKAKAYLIHRGLSLTLAEDLATEAMVEVWRQAKTFDPFEDCCQAWIFRRLSEVIRSSGAGLPTIRP